MAEKESHLRLRITANNEAEPALRGVSEAMQSIQKTAEDVAQAVRKSFDSMSMAASEGSRGMSSSIAEEQRLFREMSRTTQESSDGIGKSLLSIQEALSAVVMAVRRQTYQITESIEQMSTRTKQSVEDMKGAFTTDQILGLQMLSDTMRHIGEVGLHLFTGAIESSAEFEQNISRIHAVLMHREPTANMQAMADAALRLASDSKFSANEISLAQYELARQGLSSVQILGDGINGAVEIVNDLAQSTDEDMRRTSRVITDVMHEFNLSGDQLREVANNISGAMHTSSISMDDFLHTMRMVGPVASNMHQSMNDVSAAIALLAQHGITGSVAGTALKNMLLGLEPRTKKAAEIMRELGISAKDGAADSFYQLNGNLKSLPEIIDILNQKFSGLNDHQKQAALSAVFTKYGLSGLNTVVSESRDKFEELKKTLSEENAADIAREKMNNLAGDMQKFHAATQTMSKAFGKSMDDMMRPIVHAGTQFTNWMTNLSPEVKKISLIVLGLGSAFFAVAATIIGVGVSVHYLRPGFTALGTVFTAVGQAFSLMVRGIVFGLRSITAALMTNPITAIITAVVAIVAIAAYEIYKHWDIVKAAFIKAGEKIVEGWNWTKDRLSDTWESIKNGAETSWNAIKAFFTKTVPKLISDVGNWFSQLPELAAYWLGRMVGWFQYSLPKMYDETKQWLSQLPDRVSEWFSQVWDQTRKWWTDISIKATEKAQEMYTNVVQWITDMFNKISEWLSRLPDRIYQWFTESKNKAVEVAEELVKGVKDTISHLPDRFSEALDAVGEAIKSYGSRLLSWGAGLVDSFIAGIRSKIAAIKEAFSSGLNDARAVVETHSPPVEGPMRDIDKWGAGLMKTYADSIASSGFQVKHAVSVALAGGSSVMAPNVPAPAPAYRGSAPVVNITVNGAGKDGRDIGQEIAHVLKQQLSFAL